MYQERFMLTSQDILDKEFKVDTRGYRPQEVDKFLDIIIKDYNDLIILEIKNTDENILKSKAIIKNILTKK